MRWFRPLALFIALFVAGSLAAPGDALSGPPQLEKAKGEACIKPTGEMRRYHMDFLKHRRAETVREGVRIPDESILNCRSCHQSREKFCDECHAYVGVKPDCWSCHYYPSNPGPEGVKP